MRDFCYCSSKREKALLCVFLTQNNFRIILISFFLALGTNLFPPLLGGGLLKLQRHKTRWRGWRAYHASRNAFSFCLAIVLLVCLLLILFVVFLALPISLVSFPFRSCSFCFVFLSLSFSFSPSLSKSSRLIRKDNSNRKIVN